MTLKVRLAVSNATLRNVLLRSLEQEGDFVILPATARSDEPAADLLVVDAAPQRPDTLALIQSVRRSQPRTRVITLFEQPTDQAVRDAIAAGASGIAATTQPLRELLGAIRIVAQGGSYVCPNIIAVDVRR